MLSIVITTSPIQSHPSTDVIDQVINSFDLLQLDCSSNDTSNNNNNVLKKIQVLIVCDGYKVNQNHAYKSGKITQQKSVDYELYVERLKHKYMVDSDGNNCNDDNNNDDNINNDDSNNHNDGNNCNDNKFIFTVIQRDKNYGFADNVKYALEWITTKYVMVVQHDWIFSTHIPVTKLLQLMDVQVNINYINFISSSTTDYLNKYHGVCGHHVTKVCNYDIPLVPLPFWYDKPHICRTDYYKSHVFGKQHYNCQTLKYIRINRFVEDTYGHIILNDIKHHGLIAHAKYGTFLYYDQPHIPQVLHINGRSFRCKEQ